MADERRKHPRVSVRSADLRVAEATQFQVRAILDFSLGGIRLEIVEPKTELKAGALVDIRLEAQDKAGVFNGIIRHVEPGETPPNQAPRFLVGLEFDDPQLVEALVGPWYDDEVTKI